VTADNGSNAPDLDLLADYAAGILDGTPEGADVAERVATDPAWSELHAALVRADEAVRADLAALPAETIPADVAARLDRTLADERSRSERSDLTAVAPGPEPSNVVPLRRRRRPGAVAGGAVAAGVAVLAAGAFGLQLLTDSSSETAGSTSAADAPSREAAESPHELSTGTPPKSAPGSVPQDAAGKPASTGTDYRPANLAAQVNMLLSSRAALAPGDRATDSAAIPAALGRLTDPANLRECLTALRATAQPRAVDYATYAGAPAVIIVLPTKDPAAAEVAIVGPDCGAAGADTKLRTTLQL
jgi:negative regulator of sigma E activity